MKKIFCLVIFGLAISFFGLAQQDDLPKSPSNASAIHGLRMAFITKQLVLTTEEAQKFWPVYFSYTDDLKKVRQDKKEDVLGMEEAALNVRKKYKTEFKKLLNTDDRANKVLTVDRDFSNMLRKELQQRMQMHSKRK